MALFEVELAPRTLERFLPLVGEEAVKEVLALAERLRLVAGGRRLWSVNSTAFGGGVAEMLRPLLSYARGFGVEARWVVIDGPPDFFRLTKRLHNALHGEPGDHSSLGPEARVLYERVSRQNARSLIPLLRPEDVVLLHDPQTAGLAPEILQAGAHVVWRCHIGQDLPNAETQRAWRFLLPYLRRVDLSVFSRRAYVPAELDHGRSAVVAPSIDPFGPKNEALTEPQVRKILACTGLVASVPCEKPSYQRSDGTLGRIVHYADLISLGSPPPPDDPLVVQVSRWDELKDPIGVMTGFARLVELDRAGGAHLMLAGPNVHAVADDPDGARVFAETLERWRALPHEIRRRVHLAMLPTHDVDENAVIVNALQRHARIVVQKSLREGFGLTATEAMWKSRPVVVSAVGGLQDQVVDGVTGLLLSDPRDLVAFGDLLERLLASPAEAEAMGRAAHEHVRRNFLSLRHLRQYGEIIEGLDIAALKKAPAEQHPI